VRSISDEFNVQKRIVLSDEHVIHDNVRRFGDVLLVREYV